MKKLIGLGLVVILAMTLNLAPAFAGENETDKQSQPEAKPPKDEKEAQPAAKVASEPPKAKATPKLPKVKVTPNPEKNEGSTAKSSDSKGSSESDAKSPSPKPGPTPTPSTSAASPTPSATSAVPAGKKVYVCKYAGKPGEAEKLQTFIQVSTNALEGGWDGQTFPWSFGDAQARSVALGFVGEGHAVYTQADCPQPEPAPTPSTSAASPTPSDTATPPTEKKVYVCKYASKPGEVEKLQTFIQVSTNALEGGWDGQTFPWSFGDAQGRSVALGFVGEGHAVYTEADCPPGIPAPKTVVTETDWSGTWQCGDTEVTETRKVTTQVVPYKTSFINGAWVVELDWDNAEAPVTQTETRTRQLTADEIAERACPAAPTVEITAMTCTLGDQGAGVFTPGKVGIAVSAGIKITVGAQATPDTEVADRNALVAGWYVVTAIAADGVFTNLPDGWAFEQENHAKIRFAFEITAVDCTVDQPPLKDPTYTAWVDGQWLCGDTTVEQTRTRTDFGWIWNAETQAWDPTSVNSVETQTRELTQQEIGTCPLLPGGITAICSADAPYLSYNVQLPEGFVPDTANPLTITFVHPSDPSQNIVWSNLPLSGSRLWPGASTGNPQMWPGWDIAADGTYFPVGDANFGWTRNGVTVRFDVNPTYSTTVAYPAATSACAQPLVSTGGDDPGNGGPGDGGPGDGGSGSSPSAGASPSALAATGFEGGPLAAIALSVLVVGAVTRAVRRS